MYDRRIDGRSHTFGNQGALFMNVMAWWDYETDSIWSQPLGMAIDGSLPRRLLTRLGISLLHQIPDSEPVVGQVGARRDHEHGAERLEQGKGLVQSTGDRLLEEGHAEGEHQDD